MHCGVLAQKNYDYTGGFVRWLCRQAGIQLQAPTIRKWRDGQNQSTKHTKKTGFRYQRNLAGRNKWEGRRLHILSNLSHCIKMSLCL